MNTQSLRYFFCPTSVAVVGASEKVGNIGTAVIKNLIEGGFQGTIWGVNPKYDRVQGLPCRPRLADLSHPIDLAVVCTPAATIPKIVFECGQAGIPAVLIISAGFRETGLAGEGLETELQKVLHQFPGMRVIGPNCVGVMAPYARLNASFAAGSPQPGPIAFVSQSGALCTAILDWANGEKIGFSHFVSVGNMVDVHFGDLLAYLLDDPRTEALVLYMESLPAATDFLRVAQAFSRRKPIIVYKAGRFAASAAATRSHTGAMAGEDSVFDAAFRRAGIVRVNEMEEMFDCAELLARGVLPAGPRLGIVSNAGGPGVMATDSLLSKKGNLANLSATTLQILNQKLPPAWSQQNPVDVLGDASPERFAEGIAALLADPQVDALLALFAPQAMSLPTETAQRLVDCVRHHSGDVGVGSTSPGSSSHGPKPTKPVLACWLGGDSMQPGIELLNRAGIPTYATPEQGVAAFQYLVTYAELRKRVERSETDPRHMLSQPLPADNEKTRKLLTGKQGLVSEVISKKVLAGYGIPVNRTELAQTAEEACAWAESLGWPVALKVVSPEISHKSDVGGVLLDLHHRADVERGFRQIYDQVGRHAPTAKITGITVQKMVPRETAIELIVGAKRDATFGPVVMVGHGGVAAEIWNDRSLELVPIAHFQALEMLQRLRIWPLLKGHRGNRPVDVDGLASCLVRVGQLMLDIPDILELDMNPFLVGPELSIALDARMVLQTS